MRKLYSLMVAGVILFSLTFSGISPTANFSSGVLGSFLFLNPTLPSPTPSNSMAMVNESFDGLVLPTGWIDTAISGTYLYTFVGSGTYPTCSPHSGAGMATFQCFSYASGSEALLITPSFSLTGGQGQVSFWMYQDPGYTTNYDSIGVWVNTTAGLTGATPLGNVWRYNATAGWYQFTYNVPVSFNTATNYIIFRSHSAYGDNIYLDDISYGVPSPMTYVSSTTTQNTSTLFRGTTNNQVIGIQVVTSGSASPFTVSQLNLSTNGTTSPSTDITNAKIFYTGLSSTFSAATQYGSTVAAPNGSFSVSGSQVLATGTNYFWLTYDIPSSATPSNYVDGECASIVGSGTMGTVVPSPVAPSGSRRISSAYTLAESFDNATFPPTGWLIAPVVGTYNWTRVTSGTSPTCTPHSGAGMASFACYSIPAGNSSILASTGFDNSNMGSSDTATVSFWMYRDPGFATTYDSIGVYVNTSQSLTGATWITNIWRYNATANWYYFSYNIPRSFTGSSNFIIFKGWSQYGDNMFLDDVSISYFPSPMTYVSSTTVQNTSPLAANSTNNQIVGVQVVTNGSVSPFSITQLNLTSNGTTNATNDIRNAKIFYTGNSPVFSASTQFGTTVTNPNGAFSMTGSLPLAGGTNYFWLTYDITPGGIPGDYVDATCESIVGTSPMGSVIPVPTNPPGARQILGPMAGNYTIGNGMNYPNFNAALSDLNARNVSGAVTFLVKPGTYGTDAGTEIDSTIAVSTASISGVSATNTVTFKKKSDEVGDVWVERRGTTGTSDYVIGLLGAKYTTFDSINVRQKDTASGYNMLEWGYYITNPTNLIGSQYNTIRNCQIYLKGSNSSTCGIWQYYTATPSMPSSSNSYNTYSNNTIVNAYKGIELYGYAATSPYNLYDLGNQVTGNNLTGLGSGGLTAYVYGIYTYYQGNGFKILNNTISSAPNHAYYFYGIYPNYGYDANVDINGNTINAKYNANYTCYGIYAYYVGALSSPTVTNTVNINNNVFNVSLGSSFASGFYGIYAYYDYADTLNIKGNKFVNDTIPGSSAAYLIYPYYWGNNLNISNDTINGVYKNGAGSLYPINTYLPNFNNAKQKINNNYINNMFGTAGYNYGIYTTPATTTTSYIYNNIISNFTTTTGSGLYGIYNTSSVNAYIYGNKVNSLINSYSSGAV